jgi:hypothetical protein
MEYKSNCGEGDVFFMMNKDWCFPESDCYAKGPLWTVNERTCGCVAHAKYDMWSHTCYEDWVVEPVVEGDNCRSDICTDYGEDCCAPHAEPRGCSKTGYSVFPDHSG